MADVDALTGLVPPKNGNVTFERDAIIARIDVAATDPYIPRTVDVKCVGIGAAAVVAYVKFVGSPAVATAPVVASIFTASPAFAPSVDNTQKSPATNKVIA